MDVRRRARLSCATGTGVPLPGQPGPPLNPVSGPNALLARPAFPGPYPHLSISSALQPVADPSALRPALVNGVGPSSHRKAEARPGGSVSGHAGSGGESGLDKKDRRKDRHKRASDGRNPMIRLNPSTADRFFAVQRLLESKRTKKTSGSFVINWLIDVAHASIQAVLEQGVGAEQHCQPGTTVEDRGDGEAQEPKEETQHDFTLPESGRWDQDARLAAGMGGTQGTPGQKVAHEPSSSPAHLSVPQNSYGGTEERDLPSATLRYFPDASGGEPALFSASLAVQSGLGLGLPQSMYGDLRPLQLKSGEEAKRYSAAEIARSAMASAEAAEAQTLLDADDEDEEVDVVADDGEEAACGGAAMLQMQAFGVAPSSEVWQSASAEAFLDIGAVDGENAQS